MDIRFRSGMVGSIGLSSENGPSAQRGLDIVSISIPLQFQLAARKPNESWMLSELTADLRVRAANAANCWLLASGSLPQHFTPAVGSSNLPVILNVRCSPRALANFEKLRNGGPIQLRCELWGKIYGVYTLNGRECLIEPEPVFGLIDMDFPREKWISALRSCGLSASVFLEIPLPLSATDHFDDGFRALFDAFEAFEHGGTTAWKDTIGHIRPFLEDWKKRQTREDKEPKDGSLADREWKLLNLRDALHKCCHLWMHESKSSCSRPDAMLALATFASLLDAVRQ